ncbi:hypothetical protein PGO_110790 [Plasmodium gonderi]|uniref:Uncharacterized protein n=1 Tax=Plasmodium gonderi TaxID=77519 RepID=A0A1Y1JHA8_PLAGO|nr:hypothetical protein PGO_110790 [Plasmodium gonderi]GAW81630.1 hypothetical protein PGO_110790 [Plasmodium gonderi]
MNTQKEVKNRNSGKYDHTKKGSKNNNQLGYSKNQTNKDDRANIFKKKSVNTSGCSFDRTNENHKIRTNPSVLKKSTPFLKVNCDMVDETKRKSNEGVYYRSRGTAECRVGANNTENTCYNNRNNNKNNHNLKNGMKCGDSYKSSAAGWDSTNIAIGSKMQSTMKGISNDKKDHSECFSKEFGETKYSEIFQKVLTKNGVKKKHHSNLLLNRNCNDYDKRNSDQNVKKLSQNKIEREKTDSSLSNVDKVNGNNNNINKDLFASGEKCSSAKNGNDDGDNNGNIGSSDNVDANKNVENSYNSTNYHKPVCTSKDQPNFNNFKWCNSNDDKGIQESHGSKKENDHIIKNNNYNNNNSDSFKKENTLAEFERKPNEQNNNCSIKYNHNKNKCLTSDNLDVINREGGNNLQIVKENFEIIEKIDLKEIELSEKDENNDLINFSANRTASERSNKTYSFKRNEHQKDKDKNNEATSNSNQMNHKNGNYKKNSPFNNNSKDISFNKEFRRNNTNVGTFIRKNDNYRGFGNNKKDEYWKSLGEKNEDYAASGENVKCCENNRNGENCKNCKNYRLKQNYRIGVNYGYEGNSPNRSNNNRIKNKDIYRNNEKTFKNGCMHTNRNIIYSNYKDVDSHAETSKFEKTNDNFQNGNSYKISSYKNYYRNRNNDECAINSSRHDEKKNNNNHSMHWNSQNEQYENYERYEQNGKKEDFNFRRNNFNNKNELTSANQKEPRFRTIEKYTKKYNDDNYFVRNENMNPSNGNSNSNKKKINSYTNHIITNSNYDKKGIVNSSKIIMDENLYDDENGSNASLAEEGTCENRTHLESNQVINISSTILPSGSNHNSNENMHNNMHRNSIENSNIRNNSVQHSSNEHVNKTYAKNKHAHNNNDIQKYINPSNSNSEEVKIENKATHNIKADTNDRDKCNINNSSEKVIIKEGGFKKCKNEDNSLLQQKGSVAYIKKNEDRVRNCKKFSMNPEYGKHNTEHLITEGYDCIDAKDDEQSDDIKLQWEKAKNKNSSSKSNYLNCPENKKKYLSVRTDQMSNADETSNPFNFKELEFWMSRRYNMLLESYIDQENRKENNNEIFEEEIKIYKLNPFDINNTVEKDSNENIIEMTETLGNMDTSEKDTAKNKKKTNIQMNTKGTNNMVVKNNHRKGFSKQLNKDQPVDDVECDNYNTTKSNFISGSKNSSHVLHSITTHHEENKFYRRNNNYRPNNQKKSLQLFHKKDLHNSKDFFLSFSSGRMWDSSERGDMNERENGKGSNAEYEHENTNENENENENAKFLKKYSANEKNNQNEEKVDDYNFNRKVYNEKRLVEKRFGSSNAINNKVRSNNEFYKKKYPRGDQKNDYVKGEVNNVTSCKLYMLETCQQNNKRNNWSTKLIKNRFDDKYSDRYGNRYGDRHGDRYGDRYGDRFNDRYDETFNEPFSERLNEHFSKRINSKDKDNTNNTFYSSKHRIDNNSMLRNNAGFTSVNNSNPNGNNKNPGPKYLTC